MRSSTEPIERPPLSDDALDLALEAIGEFCDLRCPYFAGHSRGTAELVAAAAVLLHLAPSETTLARRAALVHDVGRFGVPGSVWDKPGPLTSSDGERMRMHVYYVERIFNRPEPLRRIGLLAATHHERMDGSGYHRGIGGTMLSTSARVLACRRRLSRHDPAPSPPRCDDRRRCRPPAPTRSSRRTVGPRRH